MEDFAEQLRTGMMTIMEVRQAMANLVTAWYMAGGFPPGTFTTVHPVLDCEGYTLQVVETWE